MMEQHLQSKHSKSSLVEPDLANLDWSLICSRFRPQGHSIYILKHRTNLSHIIYNSSMGLLNVVNLKPCLIFLCVLQS